MIERLMNLIDARLHSIAEWRNRIRLRAQSIRGWWVVNREAVQGLVNRGLWVDAWIVETRSRWTQRGQIGPHRFLIEVYRAHRSHLGCLGYLTDDGDHLVARVFEETVDAEGRRCWLPDPISLVDMPGFIVHLLFSGAVPSTERIDPSGRPKTYHELRKRFGPHE